MRPWLTSDACRANSEIIEIYDFYGDGGTFVHHSLLYMHSSYFRTLIDKNRTPLHGHRCIKLDLYKDSCEMLSRWLYGQPLRKIHDCPEGDLTYLADLYDLPCDAGEDSGNQDNGLLAACIDAIKQCLTEKDKTLYDPIQNLESLLVRRDKYPGKAVVLRELVYGECATDGRTKSWLEQYCAYGHEDAEEIAKLICMEFAKKACEQSQKNSGSN